MACGTKACSTTVRSITWGLVLTGSVALLIWAKLRLVTTVPRTAYADPDAVQVDRPAQPPADAPSPDQPETTPAPQP
jgi:hypothetical protein